MSAKTMTLDEVLANMEQLSLRDELEDEEMFEAPPPPKPMDYELAPDQEEHTARMREICNISPIVRDASETGLGKTFTFFELAKRLGVPLFVICPSSITETILERKRRYKNTPEILKILGYSTIAKGQRHILYVDKTDDGKEYTVAREFKEMVAQGMLFVCDEYHFAKNMNSERAQATGELIQYIFSQWEEYRAKVQAFKEGKGERPKRFRTRVLVCSATQMDKESQCLGFLKNLGYIDGPLITGTQKHLDTTNYRKFLAACYDLASNFEKLEELRAVEKELRVRLYSKNNWRILEPGEHEQREVDQILYQLTTRILFSLITSEMRPFIPRLAFNAFFDFMRKEDDVKFAHALKYLIGVGKRDLLPLAQINEGILLTQIASTYTAVQFLRSKLDADPRVKVCFASRYAEKVLPLAKKYFEQSIRGKSYKCLVLTGKEATTSKQKAAIIRRFQADNDQYRVILMTTQLGQGIDLHDESPLGRPRISVGLRDFSPIDLHQWAGRFFRRGMYTFGPCYLFNSLKYGAAYNRITKLLTDKSQVLKMVTQEQLLRGLTRFFPGYYPRCFINGYRMINGQRQDILYIDEHTLTDRNIVNGKRMRLGDNSLIARYVKNEELAFVDPPLLWRAKEIVEEDDNFPMTKEIVDESFNGLEGIYWLKPTGMTSAYVPNVGTYQNNTYDKQKIQAATDFFDRLVAEKEKQREAKKRGRKVTQTEEDFEDIDAGEEEVDAIDEYQSAEEEEELLSESLEEEELLSENAVEEEEEELSESVVEEEDEEEETIDLSKSLETDEDEADFGSLASQPTEEATDIEEGSNPLSSLSGEESDLGGDDDF